MHYTCTLFFFDFGEGIAKGGVGLFNCLQFQSCVSFQGMGGQLDDTVSPGKSTVKKLLGFVLFGPDVALPRDPSESVEAEIVGQFGLTGRPSNGRPNRGPSHGESLSLCSGWVFPAEAVLPRTSR